MTIPTKEAMYERLHEALGYEDFYGSNLDALHDKLTMIFEPTEITVISSERFTLSASSSRRPNTMQSIPNGIPSSTGNVPATRRTTSSA